MTSPTAKSDTRRAIRKSIGGRRRKAFFKNHGSTIANLPLNVPNANELAQAKSVNMAKAAKADAVAASQPNVMKARAKAKKDA